MKKIGVAGLQREQIKKTIEATAPGSFEVFIHNDMEAAMKVKSGQLDYYIGACNTGAGAALSIAIAVIGDNKSCTIAKPGIKAKDEHIAKMIAEGKVAFGLSVEHVEHTSKSSFSIMKSKNSLVSGDNSAYIFCPLSRISCAVPTGSGLPSLK